MARDLFCVTHPRACSTAFERVFMTRPDLNCIHEPFSDAFFYGPERLGVRFENDENACRKSGFAESTFGIVIKDIAREREKTPGTPSLAFDSQSWDVDGFARTTRPGKRLFIKDIIHDFFPPNGAPAKIAPSLQSIERADGAAPCCSKHGVHNFTCDAKAKQLNPTVIPEVLLRNFHFTFLIRDPYKSIPSFYRCTIPPMSELTGFHGFQPSEAGYDEVRRMFDYLLAVKQLRLEPGNLASLDVNSPQSNGCCCCCDDDTAAIGVCLIDADDLLDDPEGIIKQYCRSVGLDFRPTMLLWNDEDQRRAEVAFEKSKGFHEEAIRSTGLRPRPHDAAKTDDQWDAEWTATYGQHGAEIIRQTVDANMKHYFYLKQFAMKPTAVRF